VVVSWCHHNWFRGVGFVVSPQQTLLHQGVKPKKDSKMAPFSTFQAQKTRFEAKNGFVPPEQTPDRRHGRGQSFALEMTHLTRFS
jgi:hypothetical protein